MVKPRSRCSKGVTCTEAGGGRGIKTRRSDHIERKIFAPRAVAAPWGRADRFSLPFVSGRAHPYRAPKPGGGGEMRFSAEEVVWRQLRGGVCGSLVHLAQRCRPLVCDQVDQVAVPRGNGSGNDYDGLRRGRGRAPRVARGPGSAGRPDPLHLAVILQFLACEARSRNYAFVILRLLAGLPLSRKNTLPDLALRVGARSVGVKVQVGRHACEYLQDRRMDPSRSAGLHARNCKITGWGK